MDMLHEVDRLTVENARLTDRLRLCDEHIDALKVEVGRLRELVAHAAPMAWVSDYDMEGACAWEREAAPLVYPRRSCGEGNRK